MSLFEAGSIVTDEQSRYLRDTPDGPLLASAYEEPWPVWRQLRNLLTTAQDRMSRTVELRDPDGQSLLAIKKTYGGSRAPFHVLTPAGVRIGCVVPQGTITRSFRFLDGGDAPIGTATPTAGVGVNFGVYDLQQVKVAAVTQSDTWLVPQARRTGSYKSGRIDVWLSDSLTDPLRPLVIALPTIIKLNLWRRFVR